MNNDRELIWVEKEFAEKYKLLDDKAEKRAEQIAMFEKYMETVKDQSKAEFKNNLQNLEEDVAIYTGLMLKVKQAFEKAKNEQLDASYKLWEKFDEEIPNIRQKTSQVISELNPLIGKLEEIDKLLSKIDTYNFERLITAIEKVNNLYGQNKEMFEFLIVNFKPENL